LRRQSTATRGSRLRQLVTDAGDLIVAMITVTLRRADEMGDAIIARGGTGQISAAPSRPKQADWLALSFVSVVCGAALVAALLLGA
jgi:energy-coupling factor transporter transmembrane protein EcfT